eukprot:3292779-Prorocentrum_lima.AAC.1
MFPLNLLPYLHQSHHNHQHRSLYLQYREFQQILDNLNTVNQEEILQTGPGQQVWGMGQEVHYSGVSQ